MKSLPKKVKDYIDFKNLNIGKEPINIDLNSTLSANKKIYENMLYNTSGTIANDIVSSGLFYCNERLNGTYSFSSDYDYNNANVNQLQTNKTKLKLYMLKYYLIWHDGDLYNFNINDISGLSGDDYISIFNTIDNNTYNNLITEISEDVLNVNTNSNTNSMDDFEKEYQAFIESLRNKSND